MNTSNRERIEFYKRGKAKKILREFDFSTKDEMTIEAAILTAKRNKPDMELIAQADKIVEKVLPKDSQEQKENSKTAQDVPKEEDIAKHIAQIEMMKIKQPEKFLHKKVEFIPKSSNSLVYQILIGVILFVAIMEMQKRYGKYSFEEARQACQEQHKVLPLTAEDFMDSGYQLGTVGFWTAKGRVIYPGVWKDFLPEPDSYGYKYICVDKNGEKPKW